MKGSVYRTENGSWAYRFTIGKDPQAAVKAAVMCVDVARTVHISRQLGEPLPIPQADVDRLYDRYQNVYGQRSPR